MVRQRRQSFGAYVKAKRKTHGWSQPELARRMDVHRNVIANLESGLTKQPELETLIALGEQLQLDFNEVMTYFGAPSLQSVDRIATGISRRPKLLELFQAVGDLSDAPLSYLLTTAVALKGERDRLDESRSDGHDN